ncbi:toxin [Streptomyces sp. RSD-27]|nr:toxin [Streptomyces sp. RSD-27]
MSTELTWFKSSYSGSEGGACLEMAVAWRKSSYSGDEGGQCVEVATTPTTVHVRDSKVEDGPVLDLGPASWAALTGWVSG